jgi:exonuclease VII large subunit
MNGKKWVLATVLLLLLAGGAGAYYAFRTDPQVALVMDLGKQMRNEDLSREDRGKLFGQMREAMDQLTDEQRQQVRQQFERNNDWRKREQQKMNEFFAMSKKDQVKQLDKDIDEMVKRRKEWEKRRQERDADRAKQQAGGAIGGNNGNTGGGNGNRGGGGGGGGGDRGQQRRLSLDSSSASSQAQRAEYGRMMASRMQQRGIPMTGGPGGPGGGRRGF